MASTTSPQRPGGPAERNPGRGGFRPPGQRVSARPDRRQRKLAGRAAFGILFLLAAVTGSLGGLMLVYSADLPQIHDLERYRPSTTTDLYDRKGRPFGSFALERRVIVNYDDFAPVLRQAVISIEDKNFESHWGINVFRVMGAAWHDIASHGRAQGASTLTMQLARNLFLSSERTTARKLQEAYLAIQIERSFTKEQIFTLYGNQIYLGHGMYGFEAASEFYFSKHASQLNLTEAALLAGLPKGPVAYSPILNPEKALRRRNLVLTEMESDKAITHQQADIARAAPLGLHIAQPEMSVAPWYIEEVRRELEKQFGSEEVHEDGLRVETTLDVDLQQTANHAVLDGLAADERRRGWKGARYNVITQGGDMDEYKHPDWAMKSGPGDYVHALVTSVLPLEIRARVGNMPIVMIPADWKWTGQAHGDDLVKPGDIIYVHLDPGMEGTAHKVTLEQDSGAEGSLMAIDNTSGDILAMVGGRDYSTSQFNRATQSERQTGSSFKPYVYTTAIEEGVKPTDIIVDAPVSFGSYTPHNYEGDYKGPMTIQNAFAESRNIPALKLAARVGIHKVIDTAHRFGVTSNIPAYLPVALGAVEITLEQQVASYSVFPNDGIRVTPRLIRKVENADGITLWEQTPEVKEVISQQTARTMMQLLRAVIQPGGTAGSAAQLKHPLGGKTGTTSDFTDAWFLGFSPSITCGTWVGYDSRQSLGDKEQGARVALPIWIDFMREAIKGKDGETFPGEAAASELAAKSESPKPAQPLPASAAAKPIPAGSQTVSPVRTQPQPSKPTQNRPLPQNPAAKPATPPTPRTGSATPQPVIKPANPSVHAALPNSAPPPSTKPIVKPALPQ